MTKEYIRKLATLFSPVRDVLLTPFTILSAALLFTLGKMRVSNMPDHIPDSFWIKRFVSA